MNGKTKRKTTINTDSAGKELSGRLIDLIVRAILLTLFCSSCHRPMVPGSPGLSEKRLEDRYNDSLIIQASWLVRDGDLVMRTGNDFISLTLRQFSLQDKTYSHSGLVQIDGGRIRVFNAIGGEDNPNQTLRRDSFGYFCDPAYNFGFAVYRYNLNRVQLKRLDSIENRYYDERVKFNMSFDLKTDNRLYCTEFVYKSLLKATGDSGYIPLTHINHMTYVAPDNLYLNPHAHLIYRAVFH
ncbi:MAG TPA: hypothetical protein VNE41_12695 [Chitinophagaceae bacterium]|nr:hypothetical protein [Chitinophagaceae bacterium]